jgi:hypothetical protein
VALFEETFEAWTGADFDAYVETKWRSNRFNLERGRVRQRVMSLVEQATQGRDLAGLELWTSRDHPAFVNAHTVDHQEAFWCRTAVDRERLQARDDTVSASEPINCHAHAGLSVGLEGVVLVLRVPVDAKFDQTAWRRHVERLGAWAAEPGHLLQIDGQQGDLEALAAAASQDRPVEVRVARRIPRELALEGQGGLPEVALWLDVALPLLQDCLGPVPEAVDAATDATGSTEPAPDEVVTTAASMPPPRQRPMRPVAPAGSAHPERPAASERAVGPYRPAWARETAPQASFRAPAAPGSASADAREERPGPPPRDDRRGPPPPRDSGPPRGPVPPRDSAQPPRPDPRAGDSRPRDDRPRDDRRAPLGPPADRRAPAGPPGPRGDAPGRSPERPDDRRPRADSRPPHGDRPRDDRPRDDRFRGGPGRPYELGPDPREREQPTSVAPGARVQLLGGLFAGKVATVAEISGGQVHVMLGAMAVKVPLDQVRLA